MNIEVQNGLLFMGTLYGDIDDFAQALEWINDGKTGGGFHGDESIASNMITFYKSIKNADRELLKAITKRNGQEKKLYDEFEKMNDSQKRTILSSIEKVIPYLEEANNQRDIIFTNRESFIHEDLHERFDKEEKVREKAMALWNSSDENTKNNFLKNVARGYTFSDNNNKITNYSQRKFISLPQKGSDEYKLLSEFLAYSLDPNMKTVPKAQ